MDNKRLVLVAGAGPGLGDGIAQRFAQGGYRVVGIVRSTRESTGAVSYRVADLACAEPTGKVIGDLIGEHGAPAAVIHNTAHLHIAPFSETRPETFEATWRDMALSAFNLAQAVMPAMVAGGGGAFIVSGATASLRGGARFSAFASAKFALRGLTQSLAREYQPLHVHVCHVILDGIIDTDASRGLHNLEASRMMKPSDIAETYWQLAHQNSSAWTHEIDLRPQTGAF
jgi:NAD(P)-dependent dehydrogenase (short-subunit alcohol dehydrogenase family)